MNKVYRTVWNEHTNTWVAVQETAKARGKSSKSGGSVVSELGIGGSRFMMTAAASAMLMMSGQAVAANGTEFENGTDHTCYYDTASQSVICGDVVAETENMPGGKTAKAVVLGFGAKNTGESSIAVGSSSSSAGTASLAIGHLTKAGADQTVAVGQNAQANDRWDISIGRQAGWNAKAPAATTPTGIPEGRNVAIGDGALKNGLDVNNNNVMGTSAGENMAGSHNVVIGTYANTLQAIQSAESNGSNAKEINFKTRDIAVINGDTGLPKPELSKNVPYVETANSVAIGHRALTTKGAAVAVGQQAKAFGNTSTAVGNGTRALGDNSVAMGNTANAGSNGAIAIGQHANYQPKVDANPAEGTLAIPAAYKTVGINSIAIGVRAHSEAVRSIAMGAESAAKAVAATGGNVTDKKGRQFATNIVGATTAVGSVAIGPESIVNGTNSVAVGQASEALGQNTFAGGNDSHAIGKSSVAIGDGAQSDNDATVALGYKAIAHKEGLQDQQGTRNTNSAGAVAIGSEASSAGTGSVAVGRQSKTIFINSTAVGSEAAAVGYNTSAFGYQAKAAGTSSIAIGDKALAGSHVAGSTHTPLANRAIAIGVNTNATGETAVALGSNSESKAHRGTALGVLSKVHFDDGSTNSNANYNDGVALGSYSYANRARYTTGTDVLGAKDANAPDHVWTATHAAVSVGNDTQHKTQRQGNAAQPGEFDVPVVTRQIIGVAAGTADTDAVNVAQLKAAGFKLDLGSGTPTNIKNGDTLKLTAGNGIGLAYDPNAGLTISSTGGGVHFYDVNGDAADGNYNNDGATGKNALAAGVNTVANGTSAIAIGEAANAHAGSGALAIGSTYTGTNLREKVLDAAQVEVDPADPNRGTIKAGHEHAGQKAVNIAEAGQPAVWKREVNESVKAWSSNAIAIGAGAEAGLDQNDPTQTNAGKTGAVAVGTRALAYEVASVALGEQAGAFGKASVALGTESTANNINGVAVGSGATAEADNTVAVGFKASADGTSAVAVGDNASTHKTANQSMALGNLAKTNEGAVKGVAIGYKAEAAANIEGAVALGAHSIADRAKFDTTNTPVTAVAAPVLAGNQVYVLGIADQADKDAVAATAKDTLGAVSLGSAFDYVDQAGVRHQGVNTRQIMHVAAGTEDSDAVNVAQLKAVANKFATTPLTVTDGKVTAPAAGSAEAGKLATAGDIANAINNSGFTLTTQGEPTTASLVNPGETVDLSNDDGNIIITKGSGDNNVNFSLADTVKIGPAANPITINGTERTISGLVANLPVTTSTGTPTTAQLAPANPAIGNAATVGDVLNAGWNLQVGGAATDFVRPYDTVNFVGANGATVTTNTDGAKTTITIGMNAQGQAESAQLPVVYTDAAGNKLYKHTDDKFYTQPNGGGNEVDPPNVIASMQNAIGQTTYAMTLANVAPGVNNTDAVNVSQLKGAADALGGGAAIADGSNPAIPAGTFIAPSYTITKTDGTQYNPANNVADALKNLNDEVVKPLTFAGDSGSVERKLGSTVNIKGGATGNLTNGNIGVEADPQTGTLNVKLAENIDLGANGSVVMGDTKVDDNGLAIIGGPSITKAGINAGDKVISGVTNGVAPTDAVNVSQLQAVQAQAGKHNTVKAGTNVTVDEGVNAVGGIEYTVNAKDTVTTVAATAGETVVAQSGTPEAPVYTVGLADQVKTDIAQGVAAKDAVDNKGLDFAGDTGTTGARKLGESLKVSGDTNITTEATAAGLQIKLNPDLAVTSVKAGDTLLNDNGLAITGGPSVTKVGIDAGGKQITNVASGGDVDTNGANIGDVKRLAAAAAAAADTSASVSAGSTAVTVTPKAPVNGVTDYAVDLSQAAKDSLAKADTAVQNVVGDSNITAQKNGDTVNLSLAPVVNIGPAQGGNPVTINGNAGTIGGLTNKAFDPTNFVSGQAATEDQLAQVATAAGKRNTVSAGTNIVVTPTTANGVTNYQVATNPNMTLTSVTTTDAAGNQTVTNGNGVTITPAAQGKAPVSLTGDGLNNGGNKITNVAEGTAGTDAVNVDQLNTAIRNAGNIVNQDFGQRIDQLNGRLDQVENTANAGVAQAIATAGLPQAYLPGKSMVAVGGGYYKGETGYAVGFSTISDGGNWIIKGTASGNSRGHFGASVGAGYQW